jgi:hypothetical protein
MTFDLLGAAGRLEALIDAPAGPPRALAVLAHAHPEYGGTMRGRVMHEAARGLAAAGCTVLRFNFRGVGLSAGRFSDGPAEVSDFAAAATALIERHPGLPLWAAGYSYGAWVALVAGAADERISALIGIAAPLDSYDFSLAAASPKPKFLVHGERDEVCPITAVHRHYGAMAEPRDLVVIDGADHLFDGRASEVGDALHELLEDFAA